jgi:REP element-mobilizing transposase RayT
MGYPHHIKQWGNYRQTVFAITEDYAHYLEWLARYAEKYGLEVLVYCPMPNHIHTDCRVLSHPKTSFKTGSPDAYIGAASNEGPV